MGAFQQQDNDEHLVISRQNVPPAFPLSLIWTVQDMTTNDQWGGVCYRIFRWGKANKHVRRVVDRNRATTPRDDRESQWIHQSLFRTVNH
jgi:hypothetical protein